MEENLVAVMEAMDQSDKSPAPEAIDALMPLRTIKVGIDICCDALEVVNTEASALDKISYLKQISEKYKRYDALVKSLTAVHKEWPALAEVIKAVDKFVMVGMKAESTSVMEDELLLFRKGLLGEHQDWTDSKVLSLEDMHSNQDLALQMASIPVHSGETLVQLYSMCGSDGLAAKISGDMVIDGMRRSLAHALQVALSRPCLAQIDAGTLESSHQWSDALLKNLKKFFSLKSALSSVRDDAKKREEDGMMEEDDEDYAKDLDSLVLDGEKQGELLLKVFQEYEDYRMGHLKQNMPNLYPDDWLSFCVDLDKEKCKQFINSSDTAKIGGLAGKATLYLNSLKDAVENVEILEPWWAAACADGGIQYQAHAAVQEARMVLIGAKAVKLAHFKAAKLPDKAAKRKEVKKVKDLITAHSVEAIFPPGLLKLLNAI